MKIQVLFINESLYRNGEIKRISNLKVLFRKGISKYHREDFDDAYKCFDKIITLDPSDEESYYYLGLISLRRNKINPAIKFFRAAIMLKAKNRRAIKILGEIYERNNDYFKALNIYSKIIDEIPIKFAKTWSSYIETRLYSDNLEDIVLEVENFLDFCNQFDIEPVHISRIDDIIDILEEENRL